MAPTPEPLVSPSARLGLAVFVFVAFSTTFYWQSRDWNSASRLMLTYALVDRGTVSIDGLEQQTGDRATWAGHSYSDKLPGFAMLAAPPYALSKTVLGLSDHPTDRPGFAYWPSDYLITFTISGLSLAMTAALLAVVAMSLGCGPRGSIIVALGFAWCSPAFVYGTIAYGHVPAGLFLLLAMLIVARSSPRDWPIPQALAFGLTLTTPLVIELQVAPVCAIIGLPVLVDLLRGQVRGWVFPAVMLGALMPLLALAGYNTAAFGAPWQLGYFHHATDRFAQVHNASNPLGLRLPNWSILPKLLWGGHRGLATYAPLVLLALPGWVLMWRQQSRRLFWLTLSSVAAMLLVNLSYPEWTGGWSTGPRLILPVLPILMLPVAVFLGSSGKLGKLIGIMAAMVGFVITTLLVGVGGRIPESITSPLVDAAWPIWVGRPSSSLLPWESNFGFARNLVSLTIPDQVRALPSDLRWIQCLPLTGFQALATMVLLFATRPRPSSPPVRAEPPATPDPV